MKAKISYIYEEEWYQKAILSPDFLEDSLLDLGLHRDTIDKCRQEFQVVRQRAQNDNLRMKWNDSRYRVYRQKALATIGDSDSDHPTERHLISFSRAMLLYQHRSDGEYGNLYVETLTESLKKFFGLIILKPEDLRVDDVKIPLFKLHSPKVTGSEVTYEDSSTTGESRASVLSILGTGLGATRTVSFTQSNSFKSANGAFKLVYAPVKVQTSLIGKYENEKRTGEFLRTEVLFEKNQKDLDIGIDEISESDFFQDLEISGDRGKNFKLSGDSTTAVHKFKESWKATEELQFELGVNAFKLKGSYKAKLKHDKEVKLEFKLPSGHNYLLKKIKNELGVTWDIDK